MTPEERLTQVERILETVARYINQHEQIMLRNAEDIAQLRANTAQMLEVISQLTAITRQNQGDIVQLRATSAEVLQIVSQLTATTQQNQEEILRIWEYLRFSRDNGQPSGN